MHDSCLHYKGSRFKVCSWILYFFSKMTKTHKRFKYQVCLWIQLKHCKIWFAGMLHFPPRRTKHDDEKNVCSPQSVSFTVCIQSRSWPFLQPFSKRTTAVHSMRENTHTHQLEYNTIIGEKKKAQNLEEKKSAGLIMKVAKWCRNQQINSTEEVILHN